MGPTEQVTVIDDRYEVVGALDAGGMGVVYRAVDRRLGRPVAVKVVRTTDPRLAERSAREARLLALVDHPNVVRVYDAGVHDHHPYIVTELVSGRPLSNLVVGGALTPDQVAAICAGAAAGLAATHRVGIVHRDLKPANILVSDRGVVRLLDYGVAAIADFDTLTLDGEVVGTPRYLAPEQVAGHEIGPAADVYALGLVLIECLTGHHPFGGTAVESMGARLTRDPAVPDGLRDPWPELLAAMTAREPADRPPAAEVAELLAAAGANADLHLLGGLDGAAAGGDATAAMPTLASQDANQDATQVIELGDATAELAAVTLTSDTVPEQPRRATGHRRRWWVAFLVAAALVVAGSAVGARVLADRRSDGGTVPSTTSTEAPPTTAPTTTRAPTTTIRPTTTTAPPTTTTTVAKGRGGKPGKGGKPGG
ncbi:MAG: serine/threonine-protein kinase [Acidimicrobiales bacterium]